MMAAVGRLLLLASALALLTTHAEAEAETAYTPGAAFDDYEPEDVHEDLEPVVDVAGKPADTTDGVQRVECTKCSECEALGHTGHIQIPYGTKGIASDAFYNCKGIFSVHIAGTVLSEWVRLTFAVRCRCLPAPLPVLVSAPLCTSGAACAIVVWLAA